MDNDLFIINNRLNKAFLLSAIIDLTICIYNIL